MSLVAALSVLINEILRRLFTAKCFPYTPDYFFTIHICEATVS